MFNLDDCFALITSRSAKVFANTLDKQLSSLGMQRPNWVAMYYIYNNKNITQKGLADKMAIKEPSVARMIQTMEIEGLLYRKGNEKDKRIKYLELTQLGTKEFLRLLPVVETFKDNTIKGINEEDLALFKNIIDRMIENTLNINF